MADNDNRYRLWQTISKEYDLPDYNQFSKDMEDATKRKSLHDAVSAEYDLPDFDQFSKDMGYEAQTTQQGNQNAQNAKKPQKTAQSSHVEEDRGLSSDNGYSKQKTAFDKAAEQAWNKLAHKGGIKWTIEGHPEVKMVAVTDDLVKRFPQLEQSRGYQVPFNMSTGTPIMQNIDDKGNIITPDEASEQYTKILTNQDFDYVPKQETAAVQIGSVVNTALSTKGGWLDRMARKNMAQYGDDWEHQKFESDGKEVSSSDVFGKVKQTIYDYYNSVLKEMRSNLMFNSDEEKQAYVDNLYKTGQLKEEDIPKANVLHYVQNVDKEEQIEAVRQATLNRQLELEMAQERFNQLPQREKGESDFDYNDRILHEGALYEQDIRKLKKQIAQLDAVSDELQGNNTSWKEWGHAFNTSGVGSFHAWDLGATDIKDAIELNEVANDMKRGKQMTSSDYMALRVMSQANEADAIENAVMPVSYKSKKGGFISVPFSFGFFVGGDIAEGLTSAVNKVAGKVISKAVKGAVLKAGGKKALSAATNLAEKAANTKCVKLFGMLAKDFEKAALMENTTGAATTGAEILNRHIGTVSETDDGFKMEGESLPTAIIKGEMSQNIESQTEFLGEHFPSSLKFIRGMAHTKVGSVMGLRNLAAWLTKVSRTEFATTLKSYATRAGINGVFGEYLEEVAGTAENALLVGDQKFSDLLDVKQQEEVAGSVALSCIGMGIFGTAIYTGQRGLNMPGYYRLQHLQNKWDNAGLDLFTGEEWAKLKDRIDNTPNEGMKFVMADILRADNMTEEQARAAFNYARCSLTLRGMNLGAMKAAQLGLTDDRHIEQDNAYVEGRQAKDEDKHDIQIEFEDRSHELAEKLGISEQQLDNMSDEELESLTGKDDQLDNLIYDYQTSHAKYQGVVDNADDEIDKAAQEAARQTDMATDKSRGTVRNATIKAAKGEEDYGVYIVSGNVATNEDGSINVSESDDMILYYDPKSGKIEHCDAMRLAALGEEVNAEDTRNQAIADAKEKAIRKQAGIIDGTVGEGTSFTITDAEGNEHTYEVLADNGDGSAMITMDGNVQDTPVSLQDLQNLKDAEDAKNLEAAKMQRQQYEEEREKQNAPVEDNLDYADIINTNGNVEIAEVVDEEGNAMFPNAEEVFFVQNQGNRAKVMVLDSEGNLQPKLVKKSSVRTLGTMSVDEYRQGRQQTLKEAENESEPSLVDETETSNNVVPTDNVTTDNTTTDETQPGNEAEVTTSNETQNISNEQENTPKITLEDGTEVPMLEDGNPDFSQLTAEQVAELYDSQFGDDAEQIVSGNVNKAKKALDKANGMTVSGGSFAEQKASKKAKDNAIAEAKEKYDSAKAIADAYNERMLAKEEDTPEGRMNLIEKARRKFNRMKGSVKDNAQAIAQLYDETVGSLLHRLYDSTGIDVFDDTANTVDEYVASSIAPYSLNYEGTETSKGVKQETGLSRSDFAKTGLLAKEGKGKTIGQLANDLWRDRPSNLENITDQDVRNAIIDLITSGQTAFGLKNHIQNLRIAEAENVLEQQKRQADELAHAEKQKEEEQASTGQADDNTEESSNTEATPADAQEEDKLADMPFEAPSPDEDAPFSAKDKAKDPLEVWNNMTDEEKAAYIEKNRVKDTRLVDDVVGKKLRKAIEKIAEMMGATIQWQRTDMIRNGWFNPTTKTIYLALDSSIIWGVQFVFGHEMTHDIKTKSPAMYEELKGLVKEKYGEEKFEAMTNKNEKRYAGVGKTDKDRSYYEEETVADAIGKMINDLNLTHSLALKMSHPLLAKIHDVLLKIKNAFKETPYKESMNGIIRTIEQVYVKTANREAVNTATQEGEGGQRLSLRQKPAPKYPAGTIMGGAEEGDMNYVIFKPEDMQIVEHEKFSVKGNNEEAKEFHGIIDEMFKDGFDKSKHLRERYNLGETPTWMKTIGIKGDNFSLSFKCIKIHKGKDADHDLTKEEWHELPDAIKKPFAVTRYQGANDRFRLYVNINHNGKPVAVGIDVKRVNQGKEKPQLDVNSVKTVFAHHGEIGGSEVLVAYDEKITPQQQALLRGLNFHEYPTIQELSAANVGNSSETSKQNGDKFSLRLQNAIDETDTEPTEAQKKSGNYKKGHVKFGGYDYTIENPKGSYRSGVDENGKEWKQKMNDTYGYIRGKFGKDGDHLDMFINDNADLDSWNGDVYVVDQVKPDGKFDEHKVMYGYDSLEEAKKAYLSNYEKGWTGLGNITPVSKADFDKWLDKSNRKLKPFADYADITSKTDTATAPSSFEEFLDVVRYSIRNEKERAAAEDAYNFAQENRPDRYSRYAIVNMEKPGSVPQYLEKKTAADNWRRYYNKLKWGNYKLFDLDKPFEDNVKNLVGKFPETFRKKNDTTLSKINELTADYNKRKEEYDAMSNSIQELLNGLMKQGRSLAEAESVIRDWGMYKEMDSKYQNLMGIRKQLNELRSGKVADGERYSLIGKKGAANLDHEEEVSIRLDNLSVARQMEEAKKDAEYLEAVRSGDMEKAQKMVYDAARAAGYVNGTDYQGEGSWNAPSASVEKEDFANLDALRESVEEYSGDTNVFGIINGVTTNDDDFYYNPGRVGFRDVAASETSSVLRRLRYDKADANTKVKVYRTVPADVKGNKLMSGDWIALSKQYCIEHGNGRYGEGGYRIIEEEVPIKTIWNDGNDMREFGFDDGNNNEAEKNVPNNRKLLDAVTYDNNGNVIPLSERFNESNDDIRYSLKDEKTLAGVHNITEEKLRKVLQLGGFANPSLAVIDTNKTGHDNFGEISFIAPSALVDKESGHTAGTWTTDAYTQRYPSVERQMSDKGYDKFCKWVDGLDFTDSEKAEIKRQAADALEDNREPAWELMYLKEKGIDIKAYSSDVDYGWESVAETYGSVDDVLKAMEGDAELDEKIRKLVKVKITSPLMNKIRNTVRHQIQEETGNVPSPVNPAVRKRVREIFDKEYAPKLFDENGQVKSEDVRKIVGEMLAKYNDTKRFSFQKAKARASTYVHNNGMYTDYLRWQEEKLDDYGTKGRIFRGYKNDGTRKYVPETLENVSKAMREEADGQTNGSEYTSFGSFIAKLASRVDSTDEMRANKDKLSSNEDKEEFYEKWNDVYYDLAKFLYNDVFYGEQRLHDIVLQSDPKKYAKKEYGITLTPTFMKKLDALKNAVRTELKSAYFETKYNRPLRLNEFAAAVVPDNLGEDVRKGIENAGLPMYDYDPTKEGDRSRAFNEAINSSDNIRFSLKEEKEKIVSDAKANGTYMTAPNGEKTKLNAEQWVTVRTTNFKNWFGDWEKDPENASKVVDENGEPLVVYHGRSTDFNIFEKKQGVRFIMGLEDKVKSEGFFFTPDIALAEEFAGNSSRHRGGKANVISCFLNIRRPMDLTQEDYDKVYTDVTGWEYIVGMDTQDNLWGLMDVEGMSDKIKAKGYDGAVFVEEVNDNYEPTRISYCALDANQIKSADNNNGDFSTENDDIRYSLKDKDRKQAQMDIILKTNPMLDDYHTGIRKVEDIKTLEESVEEARSEAEKYGDEEWSAYPDITNDMLQNALETGEITIYSSKPIKNGVFVTPSYMQASDYAGGGNVYEKTVPLTDVAWINTDEGQYAKVDGERYSLKEVNDKFNDRLAQLIENPNQKDRILHLGRSSQFLIDGGIADAEIELDFDKFVRKSSEKYKNNHPFSAGDIKDLPKAIAYPVAVFNSTTKKDHVVMTELNHDGKNFIVAIRATEQNRKNKVVLEVNQITSLYPKGERGIIYWINNNKLSNVDKEKALHFIEALQPHAGTLTSEELSSAANIVRNFVNPKQNDGNLQKTEKYSLRVDRYRDELNQWKKDNNLPKDAERPQLPVREPNENAADFLKRVKEYRRQAALWATAPTYEDHLLTSDTAQGQFNLEMQRKAVLTRIVIQDSMLAIRKAQEAIMKEKGVDKLNPAEDAYTAENRSHGKAKNEFEEYNDEFLQPLRKAYNELMQRLGKSYDNVKVYMIAKHGLERNAYIAFKYALDEDYETNEERMNAYNNYKADMDRLNNDADFEAGRIDFAAWKQRDGFIRTKYAPSYFKFRFDENGMTKDYSGLSALFDADDYEGAAADLVKDVEDANPYFTDELWYATNDATKKILRDSYNAGMMTEDNFNFVSGMYRNYIPLRGWGDTNADQVWNYVGGGKGAFSQVVKEAKGRKSLADDPIAYIENMAESAILMNNRNWVKQHLLLLAQNHRTSLLHVSKAWYIKTKDAQGNEEWIPASPQITEGMTGRQVELALEAFEQKMEQMKQNGEATQKREHLEISYPQTNGEEREHEVRVMKGGEEYVIYVNGDPQLAQAVNNTRARKVREGIAESRPLRILARIGRYMSAAYTSRSPLFIPANYMRDLTMALSSTAIREDARYNYLLRRNMLRHWNTFPMVLSYQNGTLREKVRNGSASEVEKMFYDFMMNGGETGFVTSVDVEDLKKKFRNDLKDLNRMAANPKKVGHIIMDSIETLNRAIEDSNRFMVYMTSIQYGRSIEEAVNNAKDVTLNFNRKGTGEHGWQAIRDMYLFINPAVQSLQTLGALAKHHPFKFTAVTTGWLATGLLVPMLNNLLMSFFGGDDDKDKYWQFTKWDRRNNFIMWIPFTKEFVKIPLAQEFRGFYGVGDMIASKLWGGEKAEESWGDYALDLAGQIVDMLPLDPTGYDGNIGLALTPNAARPIGELALNVDFTGKPIFKNSEYNKYDPNFTKAYVGTPDWLVRISKMVNSIDNKYPDVQQNAIDRFGDPKFNPNNPAVIDHLLSSYLGGSYTMGSQIIGVATKALNGDDIKMADIPLASKFVSNPDDRPVSKKQGEEFWDMKERHDRAANTLSKLKKKAKVDGDYSTLDIFFGSDEYRQYKEDDKKVKKYEEDRKKEKAQETGEEYRPHKTTADDVYKSHTTPKDDFEDMKMKQLYEKLNSYKIRYEAIDGISGERGDAYYKANKAAIDAIEEIAYDKSQIASIKKGFLSDGQNTYDADGMKDIRELRKRILDVLEKANKVMLNNRK